MNNNKLILASKSKARQDMLRSVGLIFEAIPADIDEAAIIKDLLQEKTPPENVVRALGIEKAKAVSSENPDALVIGSDQILECEGILFSKAKNEDDARAKLKSLQGKSHRLISSAALVQRGNIIWSETDMAELYMREFETEFLNAYCAAAKDVLTSCVGAYALEVHGAWLFSKVEGNYFTILGMPLLPLLGVLNKEYGFKP